MAPGRVMGTPTQLPSRSLPPTPHFILFPLMTQGHTIPIIDMARLLADRGCVVTIVTTPLNSTRFEPTINRANHTNINPNLIIHPIRLIKLTFPCQQVGLPLGYENLDVLPSPVFLKRFYDALELLEEPLESKLQRLVPAPSCLISDRCLSWTAAMAERLGIPRIVFHGMSCFSLLSALNIRMTNAHLSTADEYEPFLVPGMPKPFHVSRAQLPGSFVRLPDLDDVRNRMQEAETTSFGVVANTFEELEHGCAQEYQNAIGKKVWCVGSVSLRNTHNLDKFERGNKPSIDEPIILEWLDLKQCGSVIYVCLGSLCRMIPAQLVEIGLGLEDSGKPFIWVVKTDQRPAELEDWLVQSGFEERVKGRGLLIKGWAPQVLILSHASVGGFLTHCGWNSTLEAIGCGIPMVTWPLFAEQFLNEKLVVEILKIGVRIGVESPVRWGNEETVGVMVTREAVKKAVTTVMHNSVEGKKRKDRVAKLAEMTRKAMSATGSSHSNLSELIDDVVKQQGAQYAPL